MFVFTISEQPSTAYSAGARAALATAAATVRGSIGNVRAVSPGHALLLASARIPAACPNGPGDYGRGAADAADAAARYLRGPAIDANASASPGHALLRAAAALEDAAR